MEVATALPFEFDVGIEFSSMQEARAAALDLVVANGWSWTTTNSRPNKSYYYCRDRANCAFEIGIVAHPSNGQAKITKYKPHTCPDSTHYGWRWPNWAKHVARHHRETVGSDLSIRPVQIKKAEHHQWGHQIRYMQAWRTRRLIQREVEGDEEQLYKKIIPLLCRMRSQRDDAQEHDGAFTAWKTDSNNRFQALLVLPYAGLRAFRHVRKFFTLDGAHLSSPYGGVLLTAAGLDGNDQIVLLGWAVVPQEIRGVVALVFEPLEGAVGII
jgi:hypothetical protein